MVFVLKHISFLSFFRFIKCFVLVCARIFLLTSFVSLLTVQFAFLNMYCYDLIVVVGFCVVKTEQIKFCCLLCCSLWTGRIESPPIKYHIKYIIVYTPLCTWRMMCCVHGRTKLNGMCIYMNAHVSGCMDFRAVVFVAFCYVYSDFIWIAKRMWLVRTFYLLLLFFSSSPIRFCHIIHLMLRVRMCDLAYFAIERHVCNSSLEINSKREYVFFAI